LNDLLRARLARREWTVTVEVVTPSPHDAAARARIVTLAEAVRTEDRMAALTLTDRTTAMDADPTALAAATGHASDKTPLVHLAGKGRDERDFEAALERCRAAGMGTVLLTGGDASPDVRRGLDALAMLQTARRCVPDIVPLAVASLPRQLRGAVSWDRAAAKRDAGAEAFIVQVSWDLAEREIVADWQERLNAPFVGAVLPLTRSRLDFLAAHRIGGIEVPATLRARVADEGPGVAFRRLALDIVLLRRLGYTGAHVCGILTPSLLRRLLDDVDHLDGTLGPDWRGVWREAVGIA
jgi:methylenetetrahydrofolate reductase (NADPH)